MGNDTYGGIILAGNSSTTGLWIQSAGGCKITDISGSGTNPSNLYIDNGSVNITNKTSANNSLSLTSGTLGQTAGNTSLLSSYTTFITGNTTYINTYAYRYATGTGWDTTASTVIQSVIDVTSKAMIEFNPQGYAGGIAITNSSRLGLKIDSSGIPYAPTATVGTNTTQIATTAFVQSAISGGGLVKPTIWNISSGNLGNGDVLNNGTRSCKIYIPTSIPFQIADAMTARFEFQYSVYGCSAYNSTNRCATAGTINLCSNNTVNNPNTTTYFDMIYGYNGGSTTQAVWRIANVQTTSNYWNTTQTYVPKNATSSSYSFTPLSFSFSFSSSNPNTITFNIGFPQNPSISTGIGDMMCCSASLRIISSPPTNGQYSDYANDTLTSTNTTGSWYFQ